MSDLRNRPQFLICLLSGAVLVCGLIRSGRAARPEKPPPGPSLYHADPQHLWNRLHAALYVRRGPDGRVYGQDRLEPLLWPASKHLLEERSHNRTVAILNEFLDTDGEKQIEEPLKRALLQRDLWLVFNWLDASHSGFADPPLEAEPARAAVERLRHPLATVIGRLALSPSEIENLPSNYEDAVDSKEFARQFDPARPDMAYLPPDLFTVDGPWVCVGRSDGPTAPQHLRDDGTNRFTNSVFSVFLRLPAGRAATAGYLKQLMSFDQPLIVRNPDDSRRFPFVPNPKLPQFPPGTEVALVRQALLIDSAHRVTPSPLTESVQLRVVYGDIPDITPQTLSDAFGSTAEARRRVGKWQSFQEFRLSRSQLFAGQAGGLRAVGVDERDLKTGFNAHPWDEFERNPNQGQTFQQMSQRFAVKETCTFCHSLPGVYSFGSLQDFRSGALRSGGELRPFPLSEMRREDVAKAAVELKKSRRNWQTLRKLLTE